MKKILYFITQSEFGGAQRYVFDLANNLKGEFEVAVALGEQANNGKLAKILEENNIKYFIIPHLKRSISPFNEILALLEIIKLIKQHKPDVIHLNSSKISILGSIASLCVMRSTLRVVYTVHGWVFNEPLPAWLKYFYLYAEKFTAGFKDKIICVSEYDRQSALRHHIAPAGKLATIHNGIPLFAIPSVSDESLKEVKNKLKGFLPAPALSEANVVEMAKILIGSIGNLYKTKGYEYLIEAANILIHDNKLSALFIVIGEGAERNHLENLIARHNLQNNFILTGRINEAAKLLKAFDIYACSSVKEGFPYSILEAMAAGRPIVSANVGGIPEMIEHEKTGLLIKPADARALAENIKLLIDNKTLGAELGAKAALKAKSEFGLEKMVSATKEIYN